MEKSTNTFRIYLIRHGETDWNREGRWQGHADVPLSAAGLQQASRLARRLGSQGFSPEVLYSSDLSRAWETAEAIGGALGLRPTAAPELREIDLGTWSGKTRGEIARAYPSDWARLEANDDFPRGGGETFAAFQARVTDWLDRTAARHPGETVAAVTHGGCIRALLLLAMGLSWADRRRIPPIENISIFILEKTGGGWKIRPENDSRHPPSVSLRADAAESPEGETN
jgi:broad specificity phosphatase PhoE